MSRISIVGGWIGITGVSIVSLDMLRYNHYQKIRDQLETDGAEPGVVKVYDSWLNNNFFNRLRYEPKDLL